MRYPLQLQAPLKDYIWGGNRLKEEYQKQTNLDRVAESWELSCHKDGTSVISNGPNAGMSLQAYLDQEGSSAIGKKGEAFEQFPVLIKLIDAADRLSVQVHPNDEYALRVEGEYGKTELWYVVDCEPGASLLYGFRESMTQDSFREHIQNNTLLEVANAVPVHPGDVFFIEAGTLHAIGKGILIAEIQQNSNTTYRVYDYGRVGVDGKPRELHIEKALEVTNLCPPEKQPGPLGEPIQKDGYQSTLLAKCEYFTVERLHLETKAELIADDQSFHAILSLDDEVELQCGEEILQLNKGETAFIPANMGTYHLKGSGTLLLTYL